MDEAKLQTLIDHHDIVAVMNRYATAVDSRDAALYRSCFSQEIEVAMLGQPRERLTADAWVAKAFTAVSGFQSTQHIITNHVITVAGDEADCVAYLQAQHWNPERATLIGGYYENRLVRSDEGWRIRHLELTMTWSQTS